MGADIRGHRHLWRQTPDEIPHLSAYGAGQRQTIFDWKASLEIDLVQDSQDKFKLIDEIARGSLYRGGRDMQTFLNGYAWGAILLGSIIIALYLIGWLRG